MHRGCTEGLFCAGYVDGTDTDIFVCLPSPDTDGALKNGEYCGDNLPNYTSRKDSSDRCESGLCKSSVPDDGFGMCAPAIEDGQPCDAADSDSEPRYQQGILEDCGASSFCRVTDTSIDLSGVCTPLVAPGQFCDGSLDQRFSGGVGQCDEGQRCISDGAISYCPAETDDGLMCPFERNDVD